MKLSVTRDKDPLDVPTYPTIPLSSRGAGRDGRVSSLHAQTMLFQVLWLFRSVDVCVFVFAHTPAAGR